MPHVVISDPPALEPFHSAFKPWKFTLEDGSIVEGKAAFLRHDHQSVLVEALAVELGPAQPFFVAIESKKRQLTVRLFPQPSPHRTPAVRAAVAKVARDVLALGGVVERTNLEL